MLSGRGSEYGLELDADAPRPSRTVQGVEFVRACVVGAERGTVILLILTLNFPQLTDGCYRAAWGGGAGHEC